MKPQKRLTQSMPIQKMEQMAKDIPKHPIEMIQSPRLKKSQEFSNPPLKNQKGRILNCKKVSSFLRGKLKFKQIN